MGTRYAQNYGWRFTLDDEQQFAETTYDHSFWQVVDIPHTLVELPLQYLGDKNVQVVGWYRKRIELPAQVDNNRVSLYFEGVANRATIYVDGLLAGTHDGAFTPFEIEIPQQLLGQQSIVVAIRCDAHEYSDIPPFGYVVDYLVQGGIYREVSLEVSNRYYISDVFCFSEPTGDAYRRNLHMQVEIANLNTPVDAAMLHIQVKDSQETVCANHEQRVFGAIQEISLPVGPVVLWDIDNPTLYTVEVHLRVPAGGEDTYTTKIGFRDIVFTTKGFFLNGKLIQLRGLNRHQDYPYVGYAMPKRQQERDAEFLKHELHVNLVRTSHYPQSPHFLNRCDELGLLVFEELPGWQHIGKSQQWRNLAVEQLRAMIIRDRNHPSIVLWGVRINESADDDELYSRTNAVAKDVDPSRPTGGVRNFANSRLLEDVYTYNDFSYSGENQPLEKPAHICKESDAPYLVSEHTGHMYPCRSSDPVIIRTEHALRHARVLDAMYADERICGAIGWCMSDYHTHKEFGGGDEICYHGVSDMFRIPKLASAVYASQQDDQPMMVSSSQFHIGEQPAHLTQNHWVFTNCDSIELLYEGESVRHYYPQKKHFAHLPHPPILLDDLIGARIDVLQEFSTHERDLIRDVLNHLASEGIAIPLRKKIALGLFMHRHHLAYADAVDLYERFVLRWDGSAHRWTMRGYVKNSVVISTDFGPHEEPHLVLSTDAVRLVHAETYDVVRCVLMLKDRYDQLLWLASAPIEITVTGGIALIGPPLVSLTGGVAAFYIRSVTSNSVGSVTVSSPYVASVTESFIVD